MEEISKHIQIVCPFCKKDFPSDKKICICGAYRVNVERTKEDT